MWSGILINFLKRYKIYIYIICGPVFLFLILNLIFPLPYYKLEEDYSTVYLDRKGELLRISLSPSGKYRIKLPLDQISEYMQKGIIQYEDKYFRYHPGINPVSLVRALVLNIKNNRIVSGASTISMQIARMLKRRKRRIWSKIIELFRAFQMELKYTKDELLEIYLNMIPMGGNIEGAGAGAFFYLGKDAKSLSIQQAALLIGLPNSPNRTRPDRYPENAAQAQKKVLSRIYKKLGFSKDILKDAETFSINYKRYKNPFYSPHLIESKKESKNKFFRQFTIDLEIQRFCENVLKEARNLNRSQEIFNGAVIVVNNKTREVLAYVGSPDYYDDKKSGQINGAAVLRSPGSALKPFLYAKAIELGFITPEKIIFDIPREYDNYGPRNFSKSSFGLVSARYALLRSLNIPAVRLEYKMGDKGLNNVLKAIFPLKKDILIERSGLSLVLGGFQVSLEKMVEIYMMMANKGLYNSLKYYKGEHGIETAPKPVLDKRSCYIISEILSEYERPDLPYNWEFTPYLAKAALKTGTSFGLRDAWCIGYNPDYTIGVWLGNMDCRGSSFLIGIKKAAPLFIKIFNYLTRKSDSWFKMPKGVAKRKICVLSGEKLGAYCKYLKEDYYIPGVSSEKECSTHKKIIVRRKDNIEVCAYCMTGEQSLYAEKIIEYWPSDVISFLRKTGRKYTRVNEHNPECEEYFVKNKPRIIKPDENAVYEVDEGLPLDIQKIALRAYTAQDADKVYWFSGSQLINEGGPDDTCFITPKRGDWVISVVDSKGRSDSVKIKVR